MKGILIGGLAGITAGTLFFIVAMILLLIIIGGHHAHGTLFKNPALRIAMPILGLAISGLGGYLAAWIAKHDEMLNGGLSSFLFVLTGLFQILAGRSTYMAAFLSLVALPASGVLGGYFRLKHRSLTPESQPK